MSTLKRILAAIGRVSSRFPLTIIVLFLGLSVAGFSAVPWINGSTNLITGVGDNVPVIKLTQSNYELFGEQDSLIIVLEFAEPPGDVRLPFIQALGEAVKEVPGVRRVRYRFIEPENRQHVALLLKHFLRGMTEQELDAIHGIFTPEGIAQALRRNRNRLFLTENPYTQQRILEDPLELGRFVADSVKKRIGQVSFGDIYLFLASPDSTVYLIQVTPSFASSDVAQGLALLTSLQETIPKKIESLTESIPGARQRLKGLKWHVTGKTAFHAESVIVFHRELVLLLSVSGVLVFGFLMLVYRSLSSVAILLAPIGVALGANYLVIYFTYGEINPVVMGTAGILFGLGTDFGVHLWGRLRETIDAGVPRTDAVSLVLQETGPPVVLGALTSVIAFLCLCLSNQPAMRQFGYVSAWGVLLALAASLFLFPACAALISKLSGDRYPSMAVTFRSFAAMFLKRPRLIAGLFPPLMIVSLIFAIHLSYEKDLFKVFLARGIKSLEVAEQISQKFRSNFSQPTFLSFEVDDSEEGTEIQRRLDRILETFAASEGKIATFDSISYLTAPRSVRERNIRGLSDIVSTWPELQEAFESSVKRCDLSKSAIRVMSDSFDRIGLILRELQSVPSSADQSDTTILELAWYRAKVRDKYRFLTKIRYADSVDDPGELKTVDSNIMGALKALPVDVSISGPRQSMEAILSSLVSELLRLGLFAMLFVVIFLIITLRHPVAAFLSLVPMIGALCVTLGFMGAARIGIPFSIIGVAPLIFGLGIDDGIHVIMRCLEGKGRSVSEVMVRITPLVIVTSITTMLGFLSVVFSYHYALEFLGWAMVIGMGSAMALTLITLPAFLMLLERRRGHGSAMGSPS